MTTRLRTLFAASTLVSLPLLLVSCSGETELATTSGQEPDTGMPMASADNEATANEALDRVAAFAAAFGEPLLEFPDSGSLIYVTNEDSNSVSIIASATQSVISTIPVGKRPRGIKVTPDGRRFYVALSGSPKCPPTMDDDECEAMVADKSADGIAEVDVFSGQVLRILPSGSDPEQFDVNWETQTLYVSNEDTHEATFLDLEAAEILMTMPTGLEPEGVRLSPDGSEVWITGEVDSSITVLDAVSGDEIARIPVGLRPRDILFTRDGGTAFISAEFGASITVIDATSHTVSGEVALAEGSLPMGLVLSEDESTLFVANGRGQTVTAIDVASRQVRMSVEVGARPWGLGMSLDSQYLYSANGPSDDVTVVNAETFEVVAKIPVQETPWGIAVGPVPAF